MEKIWTNFDEESKTIAKELTINENDKFKKLVNKLNASKNNINTKVELNDSIVKN